MIAPRPSMSVDSEMFDGSIISSRESLTIDGGYSTTDSETIRLAAAAAAALESDPDEYTDVEAVPSRPGSYRVSSDGPVYNESRPMSLPHLDTQAELRMHRILAEAVQVVEEGDASEMLRRSTVIQTLQGRVQELENKPVVEATAIEEEGVSLKSTQGSDTKNTCGCMMYVVYGLAFGVILLIGLPHLL